MTVSIDDLVLYLQDRLCGKGLVEELHEIKRTGNTTASKDSLEEIFNREFLSPTIADYFFSHVREELSLSDHQISSGLGTEGSDNCPRFGFTPKLKTNHLFTKDQVQSTDPPATWFTEPSKKVLSLKSYPDFAVREPLPISIVGEHKAYWGKSEEGAVKAVFEAAKQVVFYFGVFRDEYREGLIVVTDLSLSNIVNVALKKVRPELLARFGHPTKIHLCVLNV